MSEDTAGRNKIREQSLGSGSAALTEPTLKPEARRQLKRIGQADLVIGIPTYGDARSVGMVVQTALDGVTADLRDVRAVLINCDAGRIRGTRRAVADATADATIPVVIGGHSGRLGRGSAVRAILQAALDLNARATVILEAHTTSITADWVAALARPVFDERVDLLMPRYHRPLPDGGLGDLVFYPLVRALWGYSLRQPGAGDCAVSSALAQAVVAQDVWETEVATAGIEVWLSSMALTEGPNMKSGARWRVGQVDLGEKYCLPRATSTHFPRLFRQAVGTLLRQVYLRQAIWQALPTIQALRSFPGSPISPGEPTPGRDVTPLVEALVIGWTEYRALWQRILTAINLTMIEELSVQSVDHFTFPADLWAKVLYDFAVVYNKGERDPDRIVDSLLPLYQGRLASLWQDVAGLTWVGREGTVAAQAAECEAARDYLLGRWQTYLPWVDSGEPR